MNRRHSNIRVTLATLVAAGALAAPVAAAAEGETYAPKHHGIYAGVSDGGSKTDYFDFAEAAGRHVPVLQAFESWGHWPEEAKQRWKRTETRGMLSISTSPCYGCDEVISPQQIRNGRGDGYILRLNNRLAEWGRPTYIRLLPEMNGHWNPYSAFNTDGSPRDFAHRTKQFRKAWRRFVLIVRGGKSKRINRQLKADDMPPIQGMGQLGRRLPRTEASFVWNPQTTGSPNIRKNRPQAYWPGNAYVDWIGADIYGKFPNFSGLDKLYGSHNSKPFMIGEWSPWDSDNPTFVNTLHEWVEAHKRAKMLVYFQGFGPGNPFLIQHYPASEAAMRGQLANDRYPKYAPDSRRPGGGGGGGVTPGG